MRYACLIALLMSSPALMPPSPPSPRVAVLSIALNNLANQPPNPALPTRMRQLDTALRDRLGSACGYHIVAVDSAAEASAESAPGYLYAHPDVVVQIVGPAQADWLVIPRLNRASPWVTDLQAQVVRVRDTTIVSNRIVELKGIELTPELAARLVDRGGAWMADQVSQAIEYTSDKKALERRRCPA